MREEVGRAPEQADAGLSPSSLANTSPIAADVAVRFGERLALGRDVAVVEGEERHVEQAEQLERGVGLVPRRLHRVAAMRIQGRMEGLAAERIAARPGEAVPVADGEAEVLLHALAEHDAVLVVEAEAERLGGARPERRAAVGDGSLDA